ncbi:hypothetical protein B4099_2794 [Heyndrickxia coagulans]|uniref:Uncharacterized protein n=1 Tax=Heyndrickxia coagulans TaxID=1398 RepID=A0A150KLG3_HEYCO|nr:hypothetical protein B4099_2794 [Heyndrickxia coagulans]
MGASRKRIHEFALKMPFIVIFVSLSSIFLKFFQYSSFAICFCIKKEFLSKACLFSSDFTATGTTSPYNAETGGKSSLYFCVYLKNAFKSGFILYII